MCQIVFTGNGVRLTNGAFLGLLDGFTFTGTNQTGIGINANTQSGIKCGANMTVENFSVGMYITGQSTGWAPSIHSRNNGSNGIVCDLGSYLTIGNGISEGNGAHGVSISYGSSAYFNGGTAKNNGAHGVSVIYNAAAYLSNVTYSGNTNGTLNLYEGGRASQ